MMMTEQGMERDPEDTFDRVLCGELFWQAPPDLSSRLLELVPQAVAFNFNLPEPLVEAPAVLIRPRTWYTSLVSLLTFLAVVVSLAVALQFYTVVGAHLGGGDAVGTGDDARHSLAELALCGTAAAKGGGQCGRQPL